MVDFEEMLNNLISVEKAGFNPYTQAYSAILEPNGTTTPSTQESGLNTAQNASTKVSQQTETPKPYEADYETAWNDFGDIQRNMVNALQEKYPEIDFGAIYEAESQMPMNEWSNSKDLDRLYEKYNKLYPNVYLDPGKVKETDPRFYANQAILRQGDISSSKVPEDKRVGISTRGTNENEKEEIYSWRNFFERRIGAKQKVPYLYLEDYKEIKDEDEIVNEMNKNR